jgi:methyl-accepting chemotaxis protein
MIAKKAADEAAAADAAVKMRRAEILDKDRQFRGHDRRTDQLAVVGFHRNGSHASTLTNAADNTRHLSSAAANASQDVSESIQSTATATEEITSSVKEIGRQVLESSRVAQVAVQQAKKTDASIAELSQAANRIGDVVKLITAIADQTNLLALNATIEAARREMPAAASPWSHPRSRRSPRRPRKRPTRSPPRSRTCRSPPATPC